MGALQSYERVVIEAPFEQVVGKRLALSIEFQWMTVSSLHKRSLSPKRSRSVRFVDSVK